MTGPTRKWTSRIALAFTLWLVVCVVAFLFGNEPRPGLIALVIGTAAGTLWLYLDTSASIAPARWALVSDEPIRPRGEDTRLDLFHRVVSQHLDARDATDQLHRYLVQITDRRLVTRHGVSWVADRDRAATLLDPELADFLAARRTQRLSPAQIDRLLSRIEAL